jgi:hypothetical protein
VPILQEATILEVKRLLELFPISKLRAAWPEAEGAKDEIATAVSEGREHDQILDFINCNFSACKQHIYVYSSDKPQIPVGILAGERVFHERGGHSLYLVKVQYRVVVRDPLENVDIDFLWPVRIETTTDSVIVRFVTLEKNLASYVGVPHLVAGRSVDEDDILAAFGKLERADLHKGIKALWENGFMDCSRAKYKKPKSLAWEAMDKQQGIRENNPDLYAVLKKSVLHETVFQIAKDQNNSVSMFSADPSVGYLGFPRYSETVGDTDIVVREILRRNQ